MCFFPCSRHIAFGGDTISCLRAVKELSQFLLCWEFLCSPASSYMAKVLLPSSWGLRQTRCDIVLALNLSRGQIAKLRQVVNNSLKEVSGDGSSYWKPVAVWEEQGSCQLWQGVSFSFCCSVWNTGLCFVVNMQHYGEVHQDSHFTQ